MLIQPYHANNGAEFTLLDDVNFKASSSLDRMKVELLDPGSGTVPTLYQIN